MYSDVVSKGHCTLSYFFRLILNACTENRSSFPPKTYYTINFPPVTVSGTNEEYKAWCEARLLWNCSHFGGGGLGGGGIFFFIRGFVELMDTPSSTSLRVWLLEMDGDQRWLLSKRRSFSDMALVRSDRGAGAGAEVYPLEALLSACLCPQRFWWDCSEGRDSHLRLG